MQKHKKREWNTHGNIHRKEGCSILGLQNSLLFCFNCLTPYDYATYLIHTDNSIFSTFYHRWHNFEFILL